MPDYWHNITRARISRRRTLTGAGSLGVGALALSMIGCGGGSDNKKGAEPGASSLMGKPDDTSARAKQGGVLKHWYVADATHFDALTDASSQTVGLSSEPFYPRMLRFKTVKSPNTADGSSEGEVGESWEISPDKMTITFKIRQGMKWDNRAPTSGRVLDTQDILFSWNRFTKLSLAAQAIAYNETAAPNAPVESMTAPDARTIVVKLKSPNASILPMFSARDLLYIGPREMEGGFDPRKEVRGHGPWILEEYVPSSRFVYARNPDYYQKGRPYPDKVEMPIVSEASTQIAQFKAGNIHTDVLQNQQQNVVATKKDVPETVLLQDGRFPETSSMMMVFGWEPNSPWRDVRARQAASMMIDREAYIDVIDSRDTFRKNGLEPAVRRNSVVSGGWEGYWLDPANAKEFGENAKYLDLNIAEAKKLLSAAGYANGFDFDLNFAGQGQYGVAYTKAADVYAGMFLNGGLRPKQTPITPNDRWLTDYSRIYTRSVGGGRKPGFDGIAMVAERTYTTLAVQLFNQFNRGGQGFRGMMQPGGNALDGDPQCNDLAVKISQEFDTNKQKDLVHQLIRYATGQSYYLPRASSAKPFTLWWPSVGNAGVYVTPPGAGFWSDVRANWWVDDTKPPFKKA